MDKSITEEKLDRMLAKAEKLKGILLECENYVEAMDNVDSTAQLMEQKPQIVYTVNLGDIKTIATSPADHYTPEYLTELHDVLQRVFTVREKQKEIDLSKSGEYKKIKTDSIIIGKA